MKNIIRTASLCMIASLSFAESNITNILNQTIFSPEKGICTIVSVEEWGDQPFVDVKLNETVYTVQHRQSSDDIMKNATLRELAKAGDVITIQPQTQKRKLHSDRIPVDVVTFGDLRPSTLKHSPHPDRGFSYSVKSCAVTSLGENQSAQIVYFVENSPAQNQYSDIKSSLRRLTGERRELGSQHYHYVTATNTAHALYALAKENRNALLAQQAKLIQMRNQPRFSKSLETAALALQDANKANIDAMKSFAADFEAEQILNEHNLKLAEKRLAALTALYNSLYEPFFADDGCTSKNQRNGIHLKTG